MRHFVALLGLACAALLAAGGGHALASAGCTAAATDFAIFSGLHSQQKTVTNFAVGDAVHISILIGSNFKLTSGTSATLLSVAGNSSGNYDYTVTGSNGDTTLTLYVEETIPDGILTSATCTAAPSAPTVTSISPNNGPAAGGTVVTITGTDFTGATAVSFGSVAAAAFSVTNATTISATSPAGSGVVDVTVTTASGTSATSAGDRFTYPGGSSGGGSGTTPTDSQNVRTLSTGITKSVANVSGQVVTTQIGGAIAEAFGDSGNPITFSPGGVSINFAATPKSDIEKRTDDAFAALAYAGNPTKPPRSLAPYKEWSAWLDLRGTGWQNHDPNVGMNGAQFNATGGVGRKLTPDLLVGVFGGYEYFKYNVAALAGEMKGTGGTIGSYLGWRMSSTVRFDAALGYTRMAYSATAGTATGSFNGNRLVASSGLTGTYGYGVYKLEPSASVYALWEKQGAWTDSLGTAQADRTFSAGRTSIGSKLIRQFEYGATTLAPYVGFYGDWRFSSDNAVVGGNPVVGIGDGWSGRATAGVSWTAKGGASLALGGEYGGLGAAYKIWTGNVRASMPF